MCGIFGVLERGGETRPERGALGRTAALLRHRGPDAEGIFAEPGVGLVHTRLALLDLDARSDQPFWDETRRYALVYNGELYNHHELRLELEKRGECFRTRSDTEVVLKALLALGPEAALERFDGMFALALYDRRERTLWLARDRFGMKPLYTWDDGRRFLFASEVRALRPWLTLAADLVTVSAYLQGFEGPSQGPSFFSGVRITEPGSWLRVDARGSQSGCFFPVSGFWREPQRETLRDVPSRELVDRVEERLTEAVRRQLVADVPVGALCSGGVDSSLVLAMAARLSDEVAAFHANVVGPPTSETDAAQRLADHLGLELRAVEVRDRDFLETLPDVIQHHGCPARARAVPVLAVSRLVARHGIKAVLCGEGADELFLGYPQLAPDLRQLGRRLPRRSARRALRGDHQRGRLSPRQDAALQLLKRFEPQLGFVETAARIRRGAAGPVDPREWATLDLLHANLRRLLHRNDSMGMSAGIEARFPFLDHALAELAVNLPHRCKLRWAPTWMNPERPLVFDKWVLRQVADRYLPRELSRRRKLALPTDAFERMRIDDGFLQGSLLGELYELDTAQTRHLGEIAGPGLKRRLLQLELWARLHLAGASTGQARRWLEHHVTIAPRGARPD